ncbi:MAG: hypothetical protein AB1646_22785 [Thermodesulfobacteriota bacterium]
MPRESRHIMEARPRHKSSAHAVLAIGILVLVLAESALAQQFYLRPPNLAPSRPSVYSGAFYLNGGVKYRNVQEVSFNTRTLELINIAQPGIPAFGPSADGSFVYPDVPAGTAAADPNLSGIWLYDDGFIEPTGTIGVTTLVPYPGYGSGLGRVTDAGGTVAIDNGTWWVTDRSLQFNADPTIPTSRVNAVTWSKLLTGLTSSSENFVFPVAPPGSALTVGPHFGTPYGVTGVWAEVPSRGFQALVTPGLESRTTNKILTPFFEAGYQMGNFVDLFVGFSWFELGETFGRIRPTAVHTARRGYRDTFPFQSTDTTAGSETQDYFWSGNADIDGAAPFFSYVIYPTGLNVFGSEPTPQRRFFAAVDPSGPTFQANEIISSTVDFVAYEMRSGVRSWYPLYGLGRCGTSLSGLLAPMPYKVTTNARYVATAPETTFAVSTGDTLISVSNTHWDIWWNWGLSAGADIELGVSSLFFRAGAEYNLYFNPLNYGDLTEVKINIGGFAANALFGARF